MTAVRAALAIFLAAGLAACDEGTPDYFPLQSGSVWVYEQRLVIENHGNSGGRKTRDFVTAATDLPAESNGDDQLRPRIFADGSTLYYEDTSDGIALVGSRRPFAEAIEPISPRYLIRRPFAEGTTWEGTIEAQILERTVLGLFGTISKTIEIDGIMTYTIESLDDTVHVPAGTFRNCLRVRGTGEAPLQWEEPFGTLPVTVTTLEWFAPSVGLVKRIREEQTGKGGPLGARLEEQLADKRNAGWFH